MHKKYSGQIFEDGRAGNVYIYIYISINKFRSSKLFVQDFFISAGPPAGCQKKTAFHSFQPSKGSQRWTFFRAIIVLGKTRAVFCFLELFPFLAPWHPHHTVTIIDSGLPRKVLKTSAVDHRNSQTCRLCIFFFGRENRRFMQSWRVVNSTCHRNATELPFPLHIGFAKSVKTCFQMLPSKQKTLTCSAFYWGFVPLCCLPNCLPLEGMVSRVGMGVSHRNEPVLKLPAMSHRKVAPTGRKTHRRWKRWRLRQGKRWKSSMVMGCFVANQLRSTIYIIYSMYQKKQLMPIFNGLLDVGWNVSCLVFMI